MKVLFISAALTALAFFPLAARAEADAHKMTHGKEMNKSHQANMGHEMTLKGRLVGLTCFIRHGATGATHKMCAQQCAEKGLPMALKAQDQGLYVITGEGHASPVETYRPLLKYLEGEVVIKGKVFEKDGVKMLLIEKIKSA